MPLHDFTHVGIGATSSDNGLLVTLNFGRRPSPAALPTSTAQVEAAVTALRAEKNLPPVPVDRIYRAAAQAGAAAYAGGADREDVDQAVGEAMQREVNRLQSSRAGGCMLAIELLELAQLREIKALTRPELRLIGIGARLRSDERGKRLSTVFIVEGAPCQ